jgi:tetratricopeptide (TPR) repeat protein
MGRGEGPRDTNAEGPLNQAFEFYRARRMDLAVEAYQAILAQDPSNGEAHHLLGVIAFQQGQNGVARKCIVRAITCPGVTAEMHNNLGSVLTALGEQEEAVKSLNRAIAMRPDYVDALNNLGVLHRNAKRIEQAIEVLTRAIKINPDDARLKANLRAAYRDVVPSWHFAMMNDKPRNDAYEAAIHRAARGKRVLDIGTGAGLLTMMAARAGALRVTSCETVAVIAERARIIIERNGFGDRVNVIAKRSKDLVVGRDFTERAELLITETFSSGLVSEEGCRRSSTLMNTC